MLLISLALAFIFSPFVVLGDIVPITEAYDICQDEILTLHSYYAVTIDRDAIVSSSIKCIQLQYRLAYFTYGTFNRVPNLEYLDLKHNQIPASSLFSFGSLYNAKILNLGYQKISNTETLIIQGYFPELWYLNLRYANIHGIRNPMYDPFPKLTHLDLSGNRLSYNVDDLNVFSDTLTHLDLTDNYIYGVSLRKFANLTSLILDNNKLEAIGGWYGLSKLQNLSVADNPIRWIYTSGLTNLRYLNLSGTNLGGSFAFDNLQPLKLLEILALDRNSYTYVPDIPLNITTLSLNCNSIRYLDNSSFSGLSHLKKLFINGNNITYVYPDTFTTQTQLEELHLADNLLWYLPMTWALSMKKLRYLDLSGNEFTSLYYISYNPDLPVEHLHLERNPIRYLTNSMFEMLPKNVSVYLNMGSESNYTSCSRYVPWHWSVLNNTIELS